MRNFIVLIVTTLFMIAITSMSALAGNSGFAMTDLAFTNNGLGLINTNHAFAFIYDIGAVQSLVNNSLESPLTNNDIATVSARLNLEIIAETDSGAGGHTPLLCFSESLTGKIALTNTGHTVANTDNTIMTFVTDVGGHHPLLNYSTNNNPNFILI